MKIQLYQLLRNEVSNRPQGAVIENKMILMDWKREFHRTDWDELVYEINDKFIKVFPSREFNIKIVIQERGGMSFQNYAHFNYWQMFKFKRIYGIHWTQQPEWIKFFAGIFLGFVSGIGGGYILWLLTHKCP